MLWINTTSVTAEVINLQAARDRPLDRSIAQAMNVAVLILIPELAVASPGLAALPIPATIRFIYLAPEPGWEINIQP